MRTIPTPEACGDAAEIGSAATARPAHASIPNVATLRVTRARGATGASRVGRTSNVPRRCVRGDPSTCEENSDIGTEAEVAKYRPQPRP
jgi:hypothetical protein